MSKLKDKIGFEYHSKSKEYNIINDMWYCGPPEKDFNGKKFSGAYPSGFMANLKTCFSEIYPTDPLDILHVCSGRIPSVEGIRLDISPQYDPDFLANAEDMPIGNNRFKWTMSDTPYNPDASSKYYGQPMLNKSKVLKEMSRVTQNDGIVAVFDESIVTHAPKNLKRIAIIGVTVNPNKQIRALSVFRKQSL